MGSTRATSTIATRSIGGSSQSKSAVMSAFCCSLTADGSVANHESMTGRQPSSEACM